MIAFNKRRRRRRRRRHEVTITTILLILIVLIGILKISFDRHSQAFDELKGFCSSGYLLFVSKEDLVAGAFGTRKEWGGSGIRILRRLNGSNTPQDVIIKKTI